MIGSGDRQPYSHQFLKVSDREVFEGAEPRVLMRIGENIEALELHMNLTGQSSVIYPALLWDSDGATLVDTGIPGQLDAIRREIENAGVDFESVRRIILTHQDIDHIGGLPEIVRVRGGEIEVLAHGEDKPYIEGDKPLIKMNRERMAQMMESLPESQRQQLEGILSAPPSGKVDRTLHDGEELPLHDGIEVIHTPGHTPGHLSLFVRKARLLIAGDELRVEEGELVGPSEWATPDMESANASLRKLTDYPIDCVLCYHGGFYGPNASEKIAQLSARANDR
jgi:glyoxylase-like metal-dependent hydrolase (beta-lactamase superfamily II)